MILLDTTRRKVNLDKTSKVGKTSVHSIVNVTPIQINPLKLVQSKIETSSSFGFLKV